MSVKSTYSPRTALADILNAFSSLPNIESNSSDIKDKLDEVNRELRMTRLGHELFLWDEEVEEDEK